MLKKSLNQARLWMTVTFVAIAVSALSLSLIPYVPLDGSAASYIIGAVFWIGVIVGTVSIIMTKKVLHRYRAMLVDKKFIADRGLPGVISFTPKAGYIVLYAVTLVGLILMITDMIFTYVPERAMFPIISVTILSFTIHCVIDGKYYKAYKLIKESVKK